MCAMFLTNLLDPSKIPNQINRLNTSVSNVFMQYGGIDCSYVHCSFQYLSQFKVQRIELKNLDKLLTIGIVE
jgi:hypothetical protein